MNINKKIPCFFIIILISYLGLIFYKNNVQKHKFFKEIPLNTLRHSDFYYLNIEIEKQKIPVLLDTGFHNVLALHKDPLEKIKHKKKESFEVPSIDANGNEYKSVCYLVNSIKINDLEILEATIEEEDLEFLVYGSVIKSPNSASCVFPNRISPSTKERLVKKMGRIGFLAFKKHSYWLMDFPNSKMYYIKNWEKSLKKLKVSLDEFTEVPLVNSEFHIIISIETDFGIKNFALDTAASKTVMRCPSKNYSQHQTVVSRKFSVNKHDLKQKAIYFYDFSPTFEFDGILGIDFLKKRAILLDFKNNKIFIGPEKKNVD